MESANDITLCSKQPADVLRAQNAAFLAEYNTDDKQIDYYTNLAMRVFEEFDIDGSFTFDGVRKNVKVWYENKSGQMQLFRKHPYWSEKHKAIMLLQTETRGVDYHDAGCKYESLLNYVSKTYRPKDRRVLSVFRNGFPWCISNGIEQTATMPGKFATAMDNSCDVPPYMKKVMKEGAKITRIVRHWFSELRLESGEIVDATKLVDEGEPRTRDSFEKRYAVFADAMSELTIEKLTLVSLHFCDFMTMSNGNSWSSCHYINSHNIFHDENSGSYHGAYKLGCLSYALDKPSFILYTLPSTYDGDEHYRVQKLNRMCCQYDGGIIITGKAYPNNSNDTIQRYRDMMQTIISQCESVPNLWSCSTDISAVERYVETASDSAHYPDYMHAKQRPTVSVSRSYDLDLNKRILIGHRAYCLHCGDGIVEAPWLQCEKHRIKMVCACCGKKLNEDSTYKKYDGKYYCSDCLFLCAYHHRYEPVS
ncbi:MAG: hypothetical protein II278_08805, partial [Bacteroidaceae bacterium]|nr:hypothetical protein [Bacteroidaceae bacterium]